MKPNSCPWCDSTAVLASSEVAEDEETVYYFVECESCGAQGPMNDSEGEPLTEEEAVERWNEVAP